MNLLDVVEPPIGEIFELGDSFDSMVLTTIIVVIALLLCIFAAVKYRKNNKLNAN